MAKLQIGGSKGFDPNAPMTSALKAAAKPQLGYVVKKADKGIIFPELDRNFHVRKSDTQLMEAIELMSSDKPINIRLTGPQGCGKTESAVYFAAKYDRPVYLINCSVVRENKDWFGYKTVKDGNVSWVESDFVRACKTPRCVIVLDEFNRLHATIANALMPLLDRRRQTYIDEMGMLSVAEGIVFFATTNVGANFTGTYTMDSAHEDRFEYTMECDFLEPEEETQVVMTKTGAQEDDVRSLVKFANIIRKKANSLEATLSKTVSTRQLLQAALLMRQLRTKSLPIALALKYTVYPCFSNEGETESERAQVMKEGQLIFGSAK